MQHPGPPKASPPVQPLYAPNNGDFTFVSSADAEGKRTGGGRGDSASCGEGTPGLPGGGNRADAKKCGAL